MSDPVAPNPLISLMPMLTISLIYGGIGITIGRRKVHNLFLWVILCLVPIVNLFALLFLIAKTDKSVIATIDDLRARLDRIEAKNS